MRIFIQPLKQFLPILTREVIQTVKTNRRSIKFTFFLESVSDLMKNNQVAGIEGSIMPANIYPAFEAISSHLDP